MTLPDRVTIIGLVVSASLIILAAYSGYRNHVRTQAEWAGCQRRCGDLAYEIEGRVTRRCMCLMPGNYWKAAP